MKTYYTLLFTLLIGFQGYAQNELIDSSTKVLLVPFDRFEMHTEFSLKEINEINHLEKDQFYQELLQNFTAAFETYSGNGITYKNIEQEHWKQFKFKANYKYVQKEAHYGCDFSEFDLGDYQELLDEYNCTYLLVIPWYKIQESKEKVKTKEVRRIGLYSEHQIDFDIFNRDQERIYYEALKKFKAKATEANLKYKGLRLKDMIPTYSKIANDISIELVQRLQP